MRTDDLALAGEVVQDAAAYLGLTDLESTAHFPLHMQEFQAVLAKVSCLTRPDIMVIAILATTTSLWNRGFTRLHL